MSCQELKSNMSSDVSDPVTNGSMETVDNTDQPDQETMPEQQSSALCGTNNNSETTDEINQGAALEKSENSCENNLDVDDQTGSNVQDSVCDQQSDVDEDKQELLSGSEGMGQDVKENALPGDDQFEAGQNLDKSREDQDFSSDTGGTELEECAKEEGQLEKTSEKEADIEGEVGKIEPKDLENNADKKLDEEVLQENVIELKEKSHEGEDERKEPDLPLLTQSTVLPDSHSVSSFASEDSITPDSSSECDIEADIAIVTEGKSKKPTLAAVVKDEHGEGKLLVEALSDAARFSYCSVCAVSLGNLFENEYDRSWRKETIKLILDHLKLPEQCGTAMFALMDGMGGESLHAFVDTLMKDPVLKNNTLLLPEDLVTLAVQNGSYDARMRVLIFHVAWHMKIRWRHLEKFEEILVKMITQQAEETEEQKAERVKKEKKKKRKRYALIGLATVGGGAAIGLTAGLAAPLIAAGLGAILGTSAAAALTTTAGIAIMTSLFGAAGAGLTGYKMKKRVGAIEQFEFSPLTHGNHLHVAIAISGWLTDEQPDNFHRPWVNLAVSKEQYYLVWESKYLLELGRALEYLLHSAVTMATQEALKYTILSGLLAALTWPAAILSVASVIDNPWGVAMQRAREVGMQLAEVLMSKQQGNRPVTLIGFSLGAKVIYHCLEEMAKRNGCEGLIEEVILLGTPVPASTSHWSKFKRVVAGRIINGYCQGDWLLRFVYRTASAQMSIAGLQPIPWEDRRMVNVDLSGVVSGHLDYANKMDTILRIVGVSLRDRSTDKPDGEDKKSKKTSEDDKGREPVMEETGVEAEKGSGDDDAEVAVEALDEDEERGIETVDGEEKAEVKTEGSESGKQGEDGAKETADNTEEDIGSGFAFQDNWYSVVPQ